MATKPYFLCGDSNASSDSGDTNVVIFGSGAPERAAAAATAAAGTAVVSPELGAAAGVARPRLRRTSSGSAGKQKQQQVGGGGGAKKPPQRGLGVAELERLRCGVDSLRELSTVVVDVAGAQGHPLLHYHHHNLQIPPSPFEAAARYGSQLLAPAPPTPPGPLCFLHPPAAAGYQRAPLVAPEQQYFRDRWGRMGGFSPAGDGVDHQHGQLLPAPMAPEHPSSQSTIWRPAASSPSCFHTGHRCDICCRRMRALAGRRAVTPMPASPYAGADTSNTMPDYSIYDLAAAMATARQGGSFLALERHRGAAGAAEAPEKKEVREIEFFPAASANHTGGGRISVPDESELAVPFSSSYAGRTAPQLDLSLRL
ncbi:hypothetical protein HU200_026832 [Digitaria exilis]|uniref:Uncharacterized protein n=1 Tax=Digitaria exilis TaxID=1010633 RepID=A0A835BY91_9POAL|nr:hypothetical protein HU200_026832 [Digitaria exilis]CAB3464799.1 unnamed protein product [Digitaria exilis]